MEVGNAKGFHPFRDLSLKWSFVLYAVLCIIAALLLSVSLSGFSAGFRMTLNNIMKICTG